MEIVIAEAVRSAVGRGFKGSLSTKRPDELAADVIRGLAPAWDLPGGIRIVGTVRVVQVGPTSDLIS